MNQGRKVVPDLGMHNCLPGCATFKVGWLIVDCEGNEYDFFISEVSFSVI